MVSSGYCTRRTVDLLAGRSAHATHSAPFLLLRPHTGNSIPRLHPNSSRALAHAWHSSVKQSVQVRLPNVTWTEVELERVGWDGMSKGTGDGERVGWTEYEDCN